MKKLAAILLLAAMSAPAFAGSTTANSKSMQAMQASNQKSYYLCWYSDDGNLASTVDIGNKMKIEPYYLELTGRGGDHAWAYEIHSMNGRNCPSSVPNNY